MMDGPEKKGIQNFTFGEGVLDGACHQDQNHRREDTYGTLAEALSNLFAGHAGENCGSQAANEEHQCHDDDGVILQGGNETGTEDQNHAHSQNGYEPK